MSSMNRRDFLKTSAALSMLAAVPGLSFANGANAKRVILVRAFGGWDVTFCMDPRLTSATIDGPDWENPSNSEESIQNYNGLSIMKNTSLRPSQHEFFSRYANQTLVLMESIPGPSCMKNAVSEFSRVVAPPRADMGALLPCLWGVNSPTVYRPHRRCTGGPTRHKPAYWVKQSNHCPAERSIPIPGPSGSGIQYPLFTPNGAQRDNIESYLAQRNEVWANKNLLDAASAKRIRDLQEAYARKVSLYSERSLLLDNLSFGSGGRLDVQATTVIELMKAGLCHSASIDTGFNWDTHDTLTDQHGLYEALFSGLNVMVERLIDASMFDVP